MLRKAIEAAKRTWPAFIKADINNSKSFMDLRISVRIEPWIDRDVLEVDIHPGWRQLNNCCAETCFHGGVSCPPRLPRPAPPVALPPAQRSIAARGVTTESLGQ